VIEADEMWSFLGNEWDVWWMWVALDADTRQVVGMAACDRFMHTARLPWKALPGVYRDGASSAPTSGAVQGRGPGRPPR
jgi:insertion element IS1 protein InsB